MVIEPADAIIWLLMLTVVEVSVPKSTEPNDACRLKVTVSSFVVVSAPVSVKSLEPSNVSDSVQSVAPLTVIPVVFARVDGPPVTVMPVPPVVVDTM